MSSSSAPKGVNFLCGLQPHDISAQRSVCTHLPHRLLLVADGAREFVRRLLVLNHLASNNAGSSLQSHKSKSSSRSPSCLLSLSACMQLHLERPAAEALHDDVLRHRFPGAVYGASGREGERGGKKQKTPRMTQKMTLGALLCETKVQLQLSHSRISQRGITIKPTVNHLKSHFPGVLHFRPEVHVVRFAWTWVGYPMP